MTFARRAAFALLAAAGLALYLWPALRAPVVVNSDSVLDLGWAREGEGICTPVLSPGHPAKPGYLLFLRATGAGSPRRIVAVQSLLLGASIAATALLAARRFGPGTGLAIYATILIFLRLRDSASSVMSEALGAALFLPFAMVLLEPPKRLRSSLLLGLWAGALFLVRPNLGAAAAVLAAIALALERRGRATLALAGGFLVLTLPVLVATQTPEDPLRGLPFARKVAEADYGWVGGDVAGGEAADLRRVLAFRAFHGLLGTEFYDARWSDLYRPLTTLSRILTPFAIFASIAVLVAVPSRTKARLAKALGLTLLLLLVVQSFVFGALPRYALPFLPALFLYAVVAAPELARAPAPRRIAAGATFCLLVLVAGWQRHVLDWEWGQIESPGVRIGLRIPRGSLPERGPATLHVRIAPLELPSSAHIAILDPSGAPIYDSRRDPERRRPFITIPVPASLLAENQRTELELAVVSSGAYDAYHYVLFPVIPPPWIREARRAGSSALSPATGIDRGGLDWWAHGGGP